LDREGNASASRLGGRLAGIDSPLGADFDEDGGTGRGFVEGAVTEAERGDGLVGAERDDEGYDFEGAVPALEGRGVLFVAFVTGDAALATGLTGFVSTRGLGSSFTGRTDFVGGDGGLRGWGLALASESSSSSGSSSSSSSLRWVCLDGLECDATSPSSSSSPRSSRSRSSSSFVFPFDEELSAFLDDGVAKEGDAI